MLRYLQAEDVSEGTGRSDGGQLGDTDMDIVGLSVPAAQGMDGLHGGAQSHPFSSAGAAVLWACYVIGSYCPPIWPCRHASLLCAREAGHVPHALLDVVMPQLYVAQYMISSKSQKLSVTAIAGSNSCCE